MGIDFGGDMIPALIGVLSPIIAKALDKIPNTQEREKVRLEIELKIREQETELLKLFSASDNAQTEINKTDAASGNWLQRTWRPALCWAGVLGVWWLYLVQPILIYAFPSRPLPVLQSNGLMELMLMLLGFGGMRQFQKMREQSK